MLYVCCATCEKCGHVAHAEVHSAPESDFCGVDLAREFRLGREGELQSAWAAMKQLRELVQGQKGTKCRKQMLFESHRAYPVDGYAQTVGSECPF